MTGFVSRAHDAAHAFQRPVSAGPTRRGHITLYPDLVQGSDEWLEARRGILTASEMPLILTPTFRPAQNDKVRAHLWELLAQRISGFVEPHYVSDDMMRGWEDESLARDLYAEKVAPVSEFGFITNDRWGFTIGYSPDGIVGDDGLIEIKSRRQKYHVEVIAAGCPPADHTAQLQTALLVSERTWIDYISYCGGLPMAVYRVYADDAVQAAIIGAATEFEASVAALHEQYRSQLAAPSRLFPTERRIVQEMTL